MQELNCQECYFSGPQLFIWRVFQPCCATRWTLKTSTPQKQDRDLCYRWPSLNIGAPYQLQNHFWQNSPDLFEDGVSKDTGSLFTSQDKSWRVPCIRNKRRGCKGVEELIKAKPRHWHGFHKQSVAALQEALTDLGGKSGRKLATEPGHHIKGSHFSHLIP